MRNIISILIGIIALILVIPAFTPLLGWAFSPLFGWAVIPLFGWAFIQPLYWAIIIPKIGRAHV